MWRSSIRPWRRVREWHAFIFLLFVNRLNFGTCTTEDEHTDDDEDDEDSTVWLLTSCQRTASDPAFLNTVGLEPVSCGPWPQWANTWAPTLQSSGSQLLVLNCWFSHCWFSTAGSQLEFQDQHDVKINLLTFYHDESTTHGIELCVLTLCVWQNSYKAVTQSEHVQDPFLALEPPVKKRCARCSWSRQLAVIIGLRGNSPCSVFSLLTGWLLLGHVTGWYSSVKYMQ